MPADPATDNDAVAIPELTERQREEAEKLTSVSASVVHETVRKDGEEELGRPVSALAWSGLAAGLSMGFSFLAEALIQHYLPDSTWRPLLTNLGYPLGFLMVVVGRQQLFTENTLTAIIPLFARRNMTTMALVMRLWGVVLAANLAGAHLFAWVVAKVDVIRPEFHADLRQLAMQAADVTFSEALLRGIFAGWLIAMMVWMISATESGRLAIIIILTYIVSLGGFTHIIAGSIEVLYLAASGEKSWISCVTGYMLPTLIGNTVGGVAMVSAVNHAQVIAGKEHVDHSADQRSKPRRRR
jgi:formate/nitrite transporter FocA (FNT family)